MLLRFLTSNSHGADTRPLNFFTITKRLHFRFVVKLSGQFLSKSFFSSGNFSAIFSIRNAGFNLSIDNYFWAMLQMKFVDMLITNYNLY